MKKKYIEVIKNETENLATHLWGFTNEVVSSHQGADGHLEEVAFAVVLSDAAERMHNKQLLKGSEWD